jgi:outer membrane protein OmpA-like peptidoglycan-associated protein
MSVNLLDLFKDQVSGALVSNASKFLGESSENTSSALGNILPSILGKIVDQGSTEKGASGLMDILGKQDDSILDDIGGLFSKGSGSVNGLLNGGSGILSALLGNKIGGLVDLISGASGMKSSSSSSLLKMAAPFIFGIIKRQVANKGISGLMSLLSGQKSHVKSALPAGVGSLLGLSSFGGGDLVDKVTGKAGDVVGGTVDAGKKVVGGTVDAGKKVVGKAGDVVGDVGRGAANVAGNVADTGAKAGGSILKWLLPALLVLGALSFFGLRTGCGAVDDMSDKVGDVTSKTMDKAGDMAKGATDVVGDVAKGAADMASSAFSNVNEAAKGALGKIKFAAGSAGSQMMDFIDGGFKGDGKVTFKNLTFATGSAAISGATVAEVDNLAAILKAYPDVKLSIDGYTDNTGNADANVTLSKARADAVKAQLVKQGIDGGRIVTSGKGSASPVASNDTAEGRAQNRRIEASVMK